MQSAWILEDFTRKGLLEEQVLPGVVGVGQRTERAEGEISETRRWKTKKPLTCLRVKATDHVLQPHCGTFQ